MKRIFPLSITLVFVITSPALGQFAQVMVAGGGKSETKPRQGVAYWSLQLPKYPPMPFCPFEGLRTKEVAPGQFVYDDRKVDYEAVRAERAKQAAEHTALQARLGFQPDSPEGGGGMMNLFSSLGSNDLWLEILGGAS